MRNTMRNLLIYFFLVVGCAGVPERPSIPLSPCGAALVGSNKYSELAEYETKVMKILWTYTNAPACQKLQGWTLEVVAADEKGCWMDEAGRYVCGLTYCGKRLMKIGRDDFQNSALAHEFIHSSLECPWENTDHEGEAWSKPNGWYWFFIQESKQ
jgi:hypothetical protein